MYKQLILVTVGGGIGSALRYLVALGISKHFPHTFPLGTFAVNITGCFIIGLLVGLAARFGSLDGDLKFLLVIGFCGGYTTFSTFSAENMKLIETGNYLTLALYVAGSVVFGFLAVWGGNVLSRIITQ